VDGSPTDKSFLDQGVRRPKSMAGVPPEPVALCGAGNRPTLTLFGLSSDRAAAAQQQWVMTQSAGDGPQSSVA